MLDFIFVSFGWKFHDIPFVLRLVDIVATGTTTPARFVVEIVAGIVIEFVVMALPFPGTETITGLTTVVLRYCVEFSIEMGWPTDNGVVTTFRCEIKKKIMLRK